MLNEKAVYRDNIRTINDSELLSIHALISYMAHSLGVSENCITDRLFARFHVMSINKICSTDYDEAVKYLVDFTGKTH